MKKILFTLAAFAISVVGFSQAAFVFPSPTNANATMDLYIDNTSGASTVTIAVATNGILSAAAAAGSTANFGLLTVPSGVTGMARFTIMFTSATAYVFSRTA